MKKIIVPTDFSGAALDALKVAADIAAKYKGVTIHLVHVFEKPVSGITLQFEVDMPKLREMKKFIFEKMEDLCKSKFMKGIKTSIHVIADIEVWEFYKDKELQGADLIVMGTHGVKGNRTAFISSNTHKVLQTCSIPILTIKEYGGTFKMKNIIYASSFMDAEDADFDRIKPLINHFNSVVHLLKVNTRHNFDCTWSSKWAMEAFVKKHNLKNFTINTFNDYTVEDGILHFASADEIDMIVLETHGRTDFKQLFNPSVTQRIVNWIWKPVLSLLLSKDNSGEQSREFAEKRIVHAEEMYPGGLIV